MSTLTTPKIKAEIQEVLDQRVYRVRERQVTVDGLRVKYRPMKGWTLHVHLGGDRWERQSWFRSQSDLVRWLSRNQHPGFRIPIVDKVHDIPINPKDR